MPTKTASKKAAPKKSAKKVAPAKSAPPPTAKVPVHLWAHDSGEVFILRFSGKDGRSHGGFQHPMEVGETVTAPDWNSTPSCGGGIHGWPWGIGLGDGKEPQWDALWQVYGVKPEDVIGDVAGGPKCKFRTGVLRYKGDWHGAALFILSGQMAWAVHTAEGAATNSGDRGAATNSGDSGAATNSGDSGAATNSGYRGAATNSGYRGAATNSGYSGAATNSGDRGAATNSGDRGAATNSGYSGAATNSGDRGAATNSGYSGAATNSGDRGAATNSGDSGAALSTGHYSTASSHGDSSVAAVTGHGGRVRGGAWGCVALAWFNESENRYEMRAGVIGCGDGADGKMKANVWYGLSDAGEFEECV
jgi:hypothetical protein